MVNKIRSVSSKILDPLAKLFFPYPFNKYHKRNLRKINGKKEQQFDNKSQREIEGE